MMIPENIVDRVRDGVDIADVISRYVSIRKRGRNLVGLCPFHSEKTPSFSVNPEKQIFHCFGCGAGGNVFSFLMQHEKLNFVEAVRQLASESGIEIPESEEKRQRLSDNEKLMNANRVADHFFRQKLKSAPKSVMAYLAGRGLTAEAIEEFGIGFAPDAWSELLAFVEKEKQPLKPFESLGLILRSEKKNTLYDRFRNRLMFPIHNQAGYVIAFGGRALDKDPKTPKYINSPESPVYYKSQVLYGLDKAKNALREQGQCIFVEGYMDVIQLMQSGIRNVVATSGTALTEDHARLIRRYANRVCLCYDADSAGITAAERGGEVLFQQGIEVQTLILPAGEDPDSYVRRHGAEAFRAQVETADDYLTFRIDQINSRLDMEKAVDRAEGVRQLISILIPIRDNVYLNAYISRIADRLKMQESLLLNELQKARAQVQKKEGIRERIAAEKNPAPKKVPQKMLFSGATGSEKDIILLLIKFHKDFREYVYSHLNEDDFRNPEFRDIFLHIYTNIDKDREDLLHPIMDYLQDAPIKQYLLREIEEFNSEFKKPVLQLQSSIKQIKIKRYQAEIENGMRRLKNVSPSDPQYMQIMKETQVATAEAKKWQDVICSDK